MQLKTETKAPAGNAATDHTETEFHIDDALEERFNAIENRTSTQSTAEYRTSPSSVRISSTANELQQTSGEHPTTASCLQPLPATHYLNLFGSPDSALSDALLWARTNAKQPQVASWLEACSQWDSAIAAGEHRYQKKRRKLCKDHNILCTHLNLSEGWRMFWRLT